MATAVERLLTQLDNTREQLLVAIETLPDEGLLAPGAVGYWSIADLLVNLTAWEAEMVTALMQIDQGKKPERLLNMLTNAEAYDQNRFLENQGRDLDRVFDDLPQVRLQLEEWIEMFSDKQLSDRKRFAYFNGRSLADLIAQTTFEREKRFLPDVKAFARKWDESYLPPAGLMIPLTAVSLEEDDDDDDHEDTN